MCHKGCFYIFYIQFEKNISIALRILEKFKIRNTVPPFCKLYGMTMCLNFTDDDLYLSLQYLPLAQRGCPHRVAVNLDRISFQLGSKMKTSCDFLKN